MSVMSQKSLTHGWLNDNNQESKSPSRTVGDDLVNATDAAKIMNNLHKPTGLSIHLMILIYFRPLYCFDNYIILIVIVTYVYILDLLVLSQ